MEQELYIAIRPLTDKYAEVAILDNEEIDDNAADLPDPYGRHAHSVHAYSAGCS